MAGYGHFSRRDFIKLTTAAVGTFIGAVIGVPAIAYLIDPALKTTKSDAWIPLGKLDTFEIGKPTPVTYTRTQINGWERTATSYGFFVIKKSGTNILVLSSKCTHLGCSVNWKPDRQEFVCPCHDAQFAINGTVRGGPPPRPLDSYSGNRLKVDNGILMLHFLEG